MRLIQRALLVTSASLLTLALLGFGTLGLANAQPQGWHSSMKAGLAAAARSNKPCLVITLWGPGT